MLVEVPTKAIFSVMREVLCLPENDQSTIHSQQWMNIIHEFYDKYGHVPGDDCSDEERESYWDNFDLDEEERLFDEYFNARSRELMNNF